MSYSKTTDFPIADAARFFSEIKNSLRFEDEPVAVKSRSAKPSPNRKRTNRAVSVDAY